MSIYDKTAKRKSGRDDDDGGSGGGVGAQKLFIFHARIRLFTVCIYFARNYRDVAVKGVLAVGRPKWANIFCVLFVSQVKLSCSRNCVRSTFRMLALNNQLEFVVRMNEPNMNSDGPRNSFIIILYSRWFVQRSQFAFSLIVTGTETVVDENWKLNIPNSDINHRNEHGAAARTNAFVWIHSCGLFLSAFFSHLSRMHIWIDYSKLQATGVLLVHIITNDCYYYYYFRWCQRFLTP